MTDIVDRLRERWENMGDSAAKKITRILVERNEAADEIERLRKRESDLVSELLGRMARESQELGLE